MGTLDGKVAFITGAARGQGRSHALKLAQEGADIIAVDLCATPQTVGYPGSTPEDLAETARQVEALDRRITTAIADVRDLATLTRIAADGVAELGGLDIVCANAGIWTVGPDDGRGPEQRQQVWQETIDINLTGVWNTLEATVPAMLEADRGGSIVLTSSTAGLKGMAAVGGVRSMAQASQVAYTVAKHGVVGLMRSYAIELAPHFIRVNSIHPTGVATPMIQNDLADAFFGQHPDLVALVKNPIPVDTVDPMDISNAIAFLASDAARFITGVTLPVDAGFLVR